MNVHRGQLAPQLTHAMTQRHRPRRELSVPERHPRRCARRGRHDHAVVLDRPDAPRRRPELKHVAHARLVHELLIELSESRAVRQVHGIKAAIRNGPTRDHRHHPRRARSREAVVHAVPRHPRFELRGQVRRVLPRQHRQHLVECRTREPVIWIRATHERERIPRGPVVDAHHRDDALREHIERVLDRPRRLDVARPHRLDNGCALHQIVAKSRDHDSSAHRAEIVARAPDSLQPRADSLRTLQLDHEVHGANVDPELERAGGDQRGQLPRLERALQLQPPFSRE